MEGAMKAGNHELADEIMKSIMSAAARNLSNEEVINHETGAGNDAHRQLWSVAGHMAAFYRVLFGMTYEWTASTLHRMCRIGWSARLS